VTIAEFKTQRRWVMRDGKVPMQPNGCHAKPNDPRTWHTHAECAVALPRFSGLGTALGDGIVGIDLDDVLVKGVLIHEARLIVDDFHTYTETTPSGDGLHVLALGTLPGPAIVKPLTSASMLELKSENFYFTFTGNHFAGTPFEIMDRQPQIDALYARFRTPAAIKTTGDATPCPEAQARFVKNFSRYCEQIGAEVTRVFTRPDGRVIIDTFPCLLYDHADHGGGVGITSDGVRCVQCFAAEKCQSLGWARWSKAVEERHGKQMWLDGRITWQK